MAAKELAGRCMFIWKLAPVIRAEMDVQTFIKKVRKARLKGIWIKVADGRSRHENVTGRNAALFTDVVERLRAAKVDIWGWHVPHCATEAAAQEEATLVAKLAEELELDGMLADAEAGAAFFQGGEAEAAMYGASAREGLEHGEKGFAVCSHDIPANFPKFPFTTFAKHCSQSAPQVYYGSSSSVENRLSRAIEANAVVGLPMVPVGAAWVGEAGGCSSPSACAERAREFIRLVDETGFPGYSFWHWGGAPPKFWEVLFEK